MNPCIVSFFMNNINPKTVEMQKAVVDKYNPSKVPHLHINTQMRHGDSMDYFWLMNDVECETMKGNTPQQKLDFDVVLFLDIDALPLHERAIDQTLQYAEEGFLVGNIQRSNHIQNDQHVFVAPSCVAVRRDVYQNMGAPTARETARSDVAEEYTFLAELSEVPVKFYMPLRYDAPPIRFEWEKNQPPYWDLKDGMPKYGVGTTFGDGEKEMFWHNFQSFHPGQQERFWAKCESLL